MVCRNARYGLQVLVGLEEIEGTTFREEEDR